MFPWIGYDGPGLSKYSINWTPQTKGGKSTLRTLVAHTFNVGGSKQISVEFKANLVYTVSPMLHSKTLLRKRERERGKVWEALEKMEWDRI